MTEFSELGLSPSTLQAVADTGYTTATPIQAQAIPVALAGQDVLGIAQTGTGKTAAFTLPLVDKLMTGRAKARMPRALVLAPTRELADQVAESFAKYAKGTKLSWALLIGGVSMGDQIAKLDRGVDVLIATPGRLLDLFERSKILLTGVQILVVDEADRMLDMGFIPDIERIFKMTPPKKQTLFFSATMPPEITRLTKQFLRDPVRIEAARPATTASTITQHLVRIPSSEPKAKRMALRALISKEQVRNGIVFCNRKSEVDVVAKSLKVHGLDAAPIHGDLDQSLRMKTLSEFRSGALRLLVASDVAARGLDIPDVSHVFNYDVPHHADDYVHRIGRTGRAGKTGETYMIITPADARSLDKVIKLIGEDPKEEVLDLDWSIAEGDSARQRERANSRGGQRGGAGGRSGRDKGRERDRKPPPLPVEEQAATEPFREGASSRESAAEVAPAAAREDRPARPERGPRRERGPKPSGEAPANRDTRPPREERPRPESPRGDSPKSGWPKSDGPKSDRPREDRAPRRDRDDDGGPKVIGFGADLPAFLRPPSK